MVRNAFVISDIHLGASTSVLTAIDYASDTDTTLHYPLAEAILDKLIADIRQMVGDHQTIEQCILLGDIFDLSFASYGVTMQNGRWFFQKLVDSGLFETFIYIPGNHDHHLWQQISEHAFLTSNLSTAAFQYPRTLAPDQTLKNTFLDTLLPEEYHFEVTYPNYQFTVGNHFFYLHHGHFLQKLYIAASNLLSETFHTQNIEDLEVLNAPFLEFGWYNLGQAYNIGHKKLLDHLYFMYKNNNTREMDRLIRLALKKIRKWIIENQRTPFWNLLGRFSDWVAGWLGPLLIKNLFFRHTRQMSKKLQASSARHKRLEGSLKQAVADYLAKYLQPPDAYDASVFIFGHTHEPENDFIRVPEQARNYHVYNTGGWVVDRVDQADRLSIPQMAPLYIAEDGHVHPILFTQNHEAFLTAEINKAAQFQSLRQEEAQ